MVHVWTSFCDAGPREGDAATAEGGESGEVVGSESFPRFRTAGGGSGFGSTPACFAHLPRSATAEGDTRQFPGDFALV